MLKTGLNTIWTNKKDKLERRINENIVNTIACYWRLQQCDGNKISTYLKVSKVQNEFIKSSFLQNI